ncbi:glucokinase [Ralstonia insidiosa]|uniref:glucokinase n=1 Tax=Ralstonia insidiosa TaxID=190721 RepID=UPI000CEE7C1E|nr:glucokinase [Ralstonia insidiosa]
MSIGLHEVSAGTGADRLAHTLAYPRLVADVGGTNVRFALEMAPMRLAHIGVLAGDDYPSLEAAMRAYLAALPREIAATGVRHAAIGIANPVLGDQIRMTNRDWAFSIEAMRQSLGFDTFVVLNDFAALAHALPYLPADELEQVGGGAGLTDAPRVLLGAGTGLGVASLLPTPDGRSGVRYIAVAGEGGHVAFPPMNDEEVAIWKFARDRFGHVSAERLISGMGLELIYEALGACFDLWQQGPAVRRAADITAIALGEIEDNLGDHARCRYAVDTFCAFLGTIAANLAVTLGARGGVYIGGGIVPRLGPTFANSPFRRRFEDKGRFSAYVASMPVYVIHSPYPALIGLCAAMDHAVAQGH